MSINTYHVGDLVRVTGTFKDVDGTLTDPTVVTFNVLDPSGNITSYTYPDSPSTIQRTSTGVFYYDLQTDEGGDWHYFWEGTETAVAAEPGQFSVEKTPFA